MTIVKEKGVKKEAAVLIPKNSCSYSAVILVIVAATVFKLLLTPA
jgi:hypothetical protein